MSQEKTTQYIEKSSSEISSMVQTRMKGSGLPTQLWHLIGLEFWYESTDTKSTVEHLVTRVARATVSYINYDDGDTIQAFQEDFEGWTIEMFEKLPSEARKYFRDFIRAKGVYTGPKRGKISKQLLNLFELDPDNLPKWDEDLLREIEFTCTKSQAYRKQQELLSKDSRSNQKQSQAQTLQFTTSYHAQPSMPNEPIHNSSHSANF
ncbi:hypothetical protein GcM1_219040 [Golovinomyces cichoracearum]|uniref:Integrase and RNaseH domain-containing protein n=1 Tax=Golovinomyces cichoracearum TaxID=62708 RepID=A0A420ISB8_9PEZI|nr:hypothetical protein GcM1_219040 [Golovinomyces cichoracearum]